MVIFFPEQVKINSGIEQTKFRNWKEPISTNKSIYFRLRHVNQTLEILTSVTSNLERHATKSKILKRRQNTAQLETFRQNKQQDI